MENDKRILFLDIDGVLNSARSALVLKGFGHMSNPNKLDPIAVGLLERVIKRCGLEVVISSSWRVGYSHVDFQELFSTHYKLDLPIIDITPSGKSRSTEISNWLALHAVDDYIVLDDASFIDTDHEANWIAVNPMEGFSFDNYKQILERFGEKVEAFFI